jgi:ribonuclease P protein component
MDPSCGERLLTGFSPGCYHLRFSRSTSECHKRTYQPNNRHRAKTHGFRQRMKTRKWPAGLEGQTRQRPQACRGRALLIVLVLTNTFPKDLRLRNPGNFHSVYERGAKKASRSFVVFTLVNGLAHSRFGTTTPRKLGAAHDRNRIKRRVREIIRTSRSQLPEGLDIVVNPRRSVGQRSIEELRSEFLTLLGTSI